jgi:hypothetical protein
MSIDQIQRRRVHASLSDMPPLVVYVSVPHHRHLPFAQDIELIDS